MNSNISHLYQIAQKNTRLIIGLMSGTSLDGLDIALCRISGSGLDTVVAVEKFTTIAYDTFFREQVRSVFSKRTVDLEKVCLLNAWIAKQHGNMVLQSLSDWGVAAAAVDLVASHGQTIYHAPTTLHPSDKFDNATLQIGDGDHLAVTTGIITVSDFRQKHIAAGGEGAPLAVYGDYFIFSKKGENRILLNIGGIANFTYLPATPSAIFSTDTGPGNTLMDAYCQRYYNIPCDRDAAIALSGEINETLLTALLDHPFFSAPFPKTTGPELFNLGYLEEKRQHIGNPVIGQQDILATLNRFTAVSIANAIKATIPHNESFSIFTSGGGMHNPLLIKHLQELFPGQPLGTTDQLSINPDAKEAVLFAILANETVAGGDTAIGNGQSGMPNVSMGKISFPK